MKHLFTIVLFIVGILCISAQDTCTTCTNECSTASPVTFQPCPVDIPEEAKPIYEEMVRNLDLNILTSRTGIQWMPIHYFLVTKDDGTCGPNLSDVLESHCELNEVYNQFNIGFYISAIDTLMDTYTWTFNNMAVSSVDELEYDDDTSCNVFINPNLPGLCGFSSLPQSQPTGGGIWLNSACVGTGQKTFPHEMGHFLSLLHTFETAFGVELVNESNCTTAGDLLCDTPADFPNHSGECPYIGYARDPVDSLYKYTIEPDLYMSYFDDYCKSKFSPMEQAAMVTTLNTTRLYTLNNGMPNLAALDTATFIAPIPGDTTVNANSYTISWHPVARALYYRFVLASANSPMVFLDTLVTDTSVFVGNLFPNNEYQYIVRPISFGNTCASLSNYQKMRTSPIAVNLYASSPVCYSDLADTLVATPLGGTPPYTYYWSNYSGDSLQTGIGAGNYVLTVTDVVNHRVVTNTSIVFPAPLEVDISIKPDNLVAEVSGGVPPYQYEWNNNVTGKFNSYPAVGQYAVTVTDSKGCSTEEEFLFTGIGPAMQISRMLKVFPNPVSGSNALNIQLELPAGEEGAISLLNMDGELVQQLKREFISGTNNLRMNIAMLPSGIYLVKYTSAANTATEKFSVLR